MRALLVLLALFVLAQYASPLWLRLQGGLDYDAARHGEVVLLTTPGCGYCARMRTLLAAGGVPYRDLDVTRDAEGRRRFADSGASGVPVLFVGDEVVYGYDPDAVRAAFAGAPSG